MATHRITRDGPVPDLPAVTRALADADFRPVPPASDRDAWRDVARRPWIADLMPALLERARHIVDAGPGIARATDYLDFSRTGTRDAYQHGIQARPYALSLLVAVECLEGKGRLLDAVLDLSWALCEETSWMMPAHLHQWVPEGERLPDITSPGIDLRSAAAARALAQTAFLLAPQMDAVSPNWRRRIRHELERRIVRTYLDRECHWERARFNWNAVCTCGVTAAALLGGFDRDTRARVLHKALHSVAPFLSGFAADGGCSEGPGYWAYGVGHYAILAYYVDRATAGRIDLLADAVLPGVFAYPPKVMLDGSAVVNFADSPRVAGFRSGAVAWAAERLGVDAMVALAGPGRPRRGVRWDALDLYLFPEPRPFQPPTESVLPDLQLLVARGRARPEGQIILAVKGGHNAEHHNHNDVGNFIVQWCGRSLVADLGRGKYVKDFFSPRRYEFLATRSAGHNVPLVNGKEQRPGREFQARDFRIEREGDAIGVSMDIAAAYPPEAGVESLRRRVVLHRGRVEFVKLTDEVVFCAAGRRYELPLYTEGAFEPAESGVVIARAASGMLRIEYDPDVLSAQIERIDPEDDALEADFGPTLSRCTFTLRGDAAAATVTLLCRPTK